MNSNKDLPSAEPIDLTNCDREPIQFLGQVQAFGCLIAVSSDWMIAHASTNCADLIGVDAHDMIGHPLTDFMPAETLRDIRSSMHEVNLEEGNARLFDRPVFEDERRYDISIGQSDRLILIELEPRTRRDAGRNDMALVQSIMAQVRKAGSIDEMAQEGARGLQRLAAMDRVMVYHFEEDQSGTVIAEEHREGLESFLGLRYPASDIPKQARQLYTRNLLRLIDDVNGQTYPIVPQTNTRGAPIDLSMAITRSVSPIHLEYLRNMGVEASMSVSIVMRGTLWGLFACHHYSPFHIDFERRSAIELFAQLFTNAVHEAELEIELGDTDRARDMHDRLTSRLSDDSDLIDAFDLIAREIEQVIPFDGFAMYSKGEYRARGSAPSAEQFLGLARFLNTTPNSEVFVADCLSSVYPKAEDFGGRVAGLLAFPISRTPRDYIVLFRREVTQTVTWAGNPEKPAEYGPNGARLTPRKSFEAWQEIKRGCCIPWRRQEKRAADALRITLLEVILKFADERDAARDRSQQQQELLIAELNHRVRNILNLIRGLVSQGRGNAATIEAYSAVLDARIDALARAHDQLTQRSWNWVPFRPLIENETKAFLSEKANRITITGDEIELSPSGFTSMALVAHELVTNSAKYGSLSDSSGIVEIAVRAQPDGLVKISWRECNGPPVKAPSRKGFGTAIIERSVPYELKGEAAVDYKLTGLEARFTIPAAHARTLEEAPAETVPEQKEQAESAPSGSNGGSSLAGIALVVEDNMIIAMDAADTLKRLGAERVVVVGSVPDAKEAIASQTFSFALLDVNLGSESSLPVAQECAERGIPFALATGYGAADALLENFPPTEILRKPYGPDQVQDVLDKLGV